MIVGSVCLITINTLLYGFVTWLPVFFIKQGTERRDVVRLLASDGARRARRICDRRADGGSAGDASRRLSAPPPSLLILGIIYPMISDPVLLPAVGFALTIPIYVLVALLFGIYIPELFPTEVRLRASGIVNTIRPGRHDRDAVPGGDAV